MKQRYTYSKYVKLTGKLIEGRGWSKEKAKERFYTALGNFRTRMNHGLMEVDSFGNQGKVWVRKEITGWYLDQLEKKENEV